MKTTVKRTLSTLLTLSLLLCFTVAPLDTFAYGKQSNIRLPHTGAAWKSWAQGASPWGSITIGTGTTRTMAQAGCLLTALPMAAKSYGDKLVGSTVDNITPGLFVNKCKAVGAVTATGSYYWGNTGLVLEQTTYQGAIANLTTVSAATAKVKEYLEMTSGQYFILVDFGGAHYVTADYVSGNTLYVFDPADGAVKTLQAALNRNSSYVLTGIRIFRFNGIIRGDVDGSGIVDSTDARMVAQYVNPNVNVHTLPYLDVADFNADGYINETDSTLLLQHAVGR